MCGCVRCVGVVCVGVLLLCGWVSMWHTRRRFECTRRRFESTHTSHTTSPHSRTSPPTMKHICPNVSHESLPLSNKPPTWATSLILLFKRQCLRHKRMHVRLSTHTPHTYIDTHLVHATQTHTTHEHAHTYTTPVTLITWYYSTCWRWTWRRT